MKYFLITGGGTGAKIAEAYLHLCAAGCGPEEVHILIVDADTDNGNVSRTVDTLKVYHAIRPWGWKVQPKRGTPPLELFRTKIYAYQLTEAVSDVMGGGTLEQCGAGDAAIRDLLNLLYDEEEQTADNQFGFLARPNLGSLILAEHLEGKFRKAPAAQQFIEQIRSALGSQAAVHVTVAGSIFGGTGASLLPVAKTCVENVLGDGVEQKDRARLHFAAVMMLPYFTPLKRIASVDPARFLLDASLALQYYGLNQAALQQSYRRLYLIGSDSPARASHQLPFSISGGKGQRNPAFPEEWVAALAVQHFAGDAGDGGNPVQIYNATQPALTWENLPWNGQNGAPPLTQRFSYLLHLAAFYVRRQAGTSGGLSSGLHDLLNQNAGLQLEYFGWFDTLLDAWGKHHYPAYQSAAASGNADRWETLHKGIGEHNSATHLQAELGDYFTRLLGWASHALNSPGIQLCQPPIPDETRRDYARLHCGMCDVRPEQIQQEVAGEPHLHDNPLARLVRAALVALVKDSTSDYGGLRAGGEPLLLRREESKIPRAVVPFVPQPDLQKTADEAAALRLTRIISAMSNLVPILFQP